MKIYNYFFVMLLMFSVFFGCDNVEDSNVVGNNQNNPGNSDWLIPSNEIFDGGPGKDGIPALTNPNLTDINSISYLNDNDLVIIVKEGEEVRIYPHPILDWHEIINDKIGNRSFALTYCPLTGSGISWNRIIDGVETTFGVSGLLYNTNLIPYDRLTNSNWSQMKMQSVNGKLISTLAKTFPIIETSWLTARTLYQNSRVVSTNTGHSRNYGQYPYGNYRTNHSSLIFPVNNTDNRLNAKERVLGVFNNSLQKAYRILDFQEPSVFIDEFGGTRFLVYGDNKNNLITAFELNNSFLEKTFKKSSLSLPFIIEDDSGNHYDIFGKSRESGKPNLITAKSFIAYWFAWAAFYPNTELYKN